MKVKVVSPEGKETGAIELSDELFGGEINNHLLFQVVKSYLANARQGTAKTKSRTEVSGGGKKPWRQKGTGRARSGSNTSPVWVRGGKAHGANPRDFSNTIPKKMRKLALQHALADRAQHEKMLVVDQIQASTPKTKELAATFSAINLYHQKVLLVTEESDSNVYLSGRNIKNLTIIPLKDLNAHLVLNSDIVVFGNKTAAEKLNEVVAA